MSAGEISNAVDGGDNQSGLTDSATSTPAGQPILAAPSTPSGLQFDAADLISLVNSAIKRQMEPLIDEVRGAKKQKVEWKFRFQGNQRQHSFNESLNDQISRAISMIEKDESISAQALLRQASKDIKQRNKSIRIADKSECGWATVEEYEDQGLGSDSEDERKLLAAEERARKKKRASGQIGPRSRVPSQQATPLLHANAGPLFRGPGALSAPYNGNQYQAWNGAETGQGGRAASYNTNPYYASGQPFSATTNGPARPYQTQASRGCCFNCGEFDHWFKNCPKARKA